MGISLPASIVFHSAKVFFDDVSSLSPKRLFDSGAEPALLDFIAQVQEQDNWCWSAVATSIGLFYGSGNWTQCVITTEQVNSVIYPGEQNDCCINPTSDHCDVYGYLYFSLQQVRSFDYWESQKPTADTLFKILSRQRELLCLRIAWVGNGAHFTTIC